MKVNVSKPESWKVVLDIELPQDMVNQELEDIFLKLQRSAVLPGFRKGKAPQEIVKQQFTQQAMKEAIEKLVPKAVDQALHEHNISPVTTPSVYDLDPNKDKPLTFKISVEVKPETDPSSYRKIKINKGSSVVTDEDVQKQIDTLRERSARLIQASHDTVQEGDFVVVDYEGPGMDTTKDPFKTEKRKNQLVKIGDEGIEKFFPGFTKPLIGAKAADQRESKVVFPNDHNDKKLAGKEATFNITVQEIKERQLPEVNDEFAKEVGLDSISVLKDNIRENLQSQRDAKVKRSMENQLIDDIIKNNEIECPPSLVEQEMDYIVARTKEYFARQGINPAQMGAKDEELREKCREDALRNVKAHLLLESISKKENIQVSDEEFDKRLQETIEHNKDASDKVKEHFTKYKSDIIAQMVQENTFKFLLDNAKVKEVK
ncbi:MAG: trigger factor [bacterium]